MKSFLAALRTLVLPYGTTTGKRIILDGVNGRIEVYAASNDRIAFIDDTGVWVTDPDGSYVRIYDETVGSAAVIALRSENIDGIATTPATIAARVVNDFGSDAPVLDIFGPRSAPGNIAYTRYYGPDADGPYSRIVSGCDYYDIYADEDYTLSALGFVDIFAPEIYLSGSTYVYGDFLIDLNGTEKSQGRGVVTTATANSSSATITSTTATAVLTTASAVFEAGRAYRAEIGGGFLAPGASTATLVDARLFVGATEIAEYLRFPIAGTPVRNGTSFVYFRNTTGSNVTATASLRIATNVAGQGVQQFGFTTRKRYLKIWDVGDAADFPEAETV